MPKKRTKNWQEVQNVTEFYKKVEEDIKEKQEKAWELKKVKPLTKGQEKFIKEIEVNTITICDGPAGCGKTMISIGVGLDMLVNNRVNQLVFIRPNIECDGELGFLPGNVDEKMQAFMFLFHEIARKFLPNHEIKRLMEEQKIKLVPILYLRGVTFDDAFVIADEAENFTKRQLKMLLTRIGLDTRMVISGDSSQSDLPYNDTNSLQYIMSKLAGIDAISTIKMTRDDIVRSRLVQVIDERL